MLAKKIKKSVKKNWKCCVNSLIFAPASREKRLEKLMRKVLKNFEKKFWNLLEIPKFALPLHPLMNQTMILGEIKRFWKISEKKVSKSLVVTKKGLTFAPLSAKKKRTGSKTRPKGWVWKIKEIVLYSNIIEQRSLKYLSSKVFIHS